MTEKGHGDVGIEIVEVASRRTRRDFLDVPGIVYRDDPNWIAPLRFIERDRTMPRRHPFYEHGDGCFWVAYRAGRPVGRLGALVNRLHLEVHGDGTGHFSMFEALDDPAAIAALFARAEAWLRARGMHRIAGPFNLSTNEEVGMLVEGFHRPPVVGTGHGRPYYRARLEDLGYATEIDLFAFWRDLRYSEVERLLPRLEETVEHAGIEIRTSSRRRFKDDVRNLIALYNDAWRHNWGFVPATDAEARQFVKDLKFILKPQHMLIAERDGAVVAMIVGIQNLNEALAGLGGRLLPFGWIRLLWRLKSRRVRIARVPLAGVASALQGQPVGGMLPMLMLLRLRDAANAYGITHMEGSWVLETNEPIIKYYRLGGFEADKRYRIFAKPL